MGPPKPLIDVALSPEELFQRLRTAARNRVYGIRYLDSGAAVSKISPKACQMIQSMGIHPLLNSIRPLLIRDWNVPNWPAHSSSKDLHNLPYGGSFANQSIGALRGQARIGK